MCILNDNEVIAINVVNYFLVLKNRAMSVPAKKLNFTCWVFSALFLFANSLRCKTPDQRSGLCTKLENCPPLSSLLKRNSEVDKIFILLSRCAQSEEIKYCCVDDDDNENIIQTSNTETRSLVEEKRCPQAADGLCIELKDCPLLLSILKDGDYTAVKQKAFRESLCGFTGNKAKVCCPVLVSNDVSGTTTRKPPEPEGQIFPSLLPDETVCGIGFCERIRGGTTAGLFEFPWMALLNYKIGSNSNFLCGGMLINNRYVLTAAHCIPDSRALNNSKLKSVRLGEYNIANATDCEIDDCNDPIDVEINEEIIHEGYNRYYHQHNDIALLRLKKEVTFTDFIRPICLLTTPEVRAKIKIGSNVTVAGWGTTETRLPSDVLLKVDLKVRPLNECVGGYFPQPIMHPGQMCAGGDKRDTCKGDSGGPLMTPYDMTSANTYAVGIVSFGSEGCATNNLPAVYTNISYYIPWIISKLKP